MSLNLTLIGHLSLIFFLWTLIALCIFFLFISPKIYKNLKEAEKLCASKRKDFLHHFVPLILNSSNYNKNIQALFTKDTILLKVGFALTKKLLR